jgi:hypothetical protein
VRSTAVQAHRSEAIPISVDLAESPESLSLIKSRTVNGLSLRKLKRFSSVRRRWNSKLVYWSTALNGRKGRESPFFDPLFYPLQVHHRMPPLLPTMESEIRGIREDPVNRLAGKGASTEVDSVYL